MTRALRIWSGVLVSLALVGFAITVLVFEIWFGLHAIPTTATVESYVGAGIWAGRGKAHVVHDVEGQPAKAILRTWFFHRLREGERVDVLYLPGEPNRVEMDSVVQRFGPVPIPLGIALVVAYSAGLLRPGRRPQSGSGAADQVGEL